MKKGEQDCLNIQGLAKRYDGFYLDHIDLTVPRGAIVGLIGENGAGKSTMIKAALDLIQKDEGEAKFFGKTLAEEPIGLREEIGVVFDSLNFSEVLTMKQVGSICKNIYRNWDGQAWNHYMERFGLTSDRRLKDFSKGMKMKCSLAVALSHHARLLILDEPTSGLDPVVREEVLDLFLDFMQDEDHGILLSSHITSDLEKIADYIAFIHEGKLLFQKNKDEILYRYGVIRCSKKDFAAIDPADIVAYREEEYQVNVLTEDRDRAESRYGNMVVDKVSIDEIMNLYIKGHTTAEGGR
ncbi:MAG: ABC transporter ATP-binding protein [Firmicutes bacterium]|nr:ABC transporter ATP-binding protein [Bacillota bacterium]